MSTVAFLRFLVILVWVLVITSCSVKPRGSFLRDECPPVPDYSTYDTWAAHPAKQDSADLIPDPALTDRQDHADVDVFFVHPTTYTGKFGHNEWNADIHDEKVNERTDKGTIRYQATIFNGAGRVFAPRYRQAHLEAFYTKRRRDDARKALELAFEDVRSAFLYYQEHHNEGRPVIIAGHSQGTMHAARLLREYFDGKPLQEQLVVAYLVGMPVRDSYFNAIPVCETEDDIGCYCSWRTVREDFVPKKWRTPDAEITVTNPLTWSTNGDFADRSLNEGAVLRHFRDGILPEFTGAEIEDNWLWIPRPKLPGVPILLTRNYHIADYNLFYVNVRKNAQLRAEVYFHERS